jgi:hypothetical protein
MWLRLRAESVNETIKLRILAMLNFPYLHIFVLITTYLAREAIPTDSMVFLPAER